MAEQHPINGLMGTSMEKIRDIDTAPPDITFDDPELERAFQGYLSSQEKNGRELSDYQVRLLRKKLGSLSDDMAEQLMIVEEAIFPWLVMFSPLLARRPV